jgi:hypothetical protein
VGWEVHEREVATHAATLIHRICADSGVDLTGLVLHSDNGKAMRGSTMIAMLQWLGVVLSSADRTSVTTTRTPRLCSARSSTRQCARAYPSLTVRPRVAGWIVS